MSLTLSSSTLSLYHQCQRKYYFQQILGRGEDDSVDLHVGKCFAAALEAGRKAFFQQGKSFMHAEEEAECVLHYQWGEPTLYASEGKNLERTALALEKYWETWEMPSDYRCVQVEEYFEVPLGNGSYGGRPDALVEGPGGLWLLDEKTTGGYLGDRWARQWTRRGQFIGYKWAYKQMGIDVLGVIVRGVQISKSKIAFQELPIPVPDHLIAEWLHTVQDEVYVIDARTEECAGDLSAWRPDHTGSACTSYGRPCQYIDACNSPRPLEIVMAMPKSKYDSKTREVSRDSK